MDSGGWDMETVVWGSKRDGTPLWVSGRLLASFAIASPEISMGGQAFAGWSLLKCSPISCMQ
jgi:hypothetical protein